MRQGKSVKKDKTLRFKDLSRQEQPRTEKLSEADMLRNQLETLRRENEQLSAEREQFIASFRLISHDLRAPVRAIAQLSEWIVDDCMGQLPGDAEENLVMMRARAERLDFMHRDLNSYVRCNELFEKHPSPLNLPTLIARVWQELTETFRDRQHFEFAVDIDKDAEVYLGHGPVIEEILRCVISNAIIHHDREDGFISVTVRANKERLRLCVDDDGPGIPLHMCEQALAPMKTLRARDKGAGSGLGLAKVDRLVKLSKGKLQMQYTFATTSRGLRVTCDLPVYSQSEA